MPLIALAPVHAAACAPALARPGAAGARARAPALAALPRRAAAAVPSANFCAAPHARPVPRRATPARAAAGSEPPTAPLAAGIPTLPPALPPPKGTTQSATPRLTVAYKVAAATLSLLALRLAIAPEALPSIIAWSGADLAPSALLIGRVWGAGFIPAAVACAALSEAATHARLTSDTYKRLNIGLLAFATATLALLAPLADAAATDAAAALPGVCCFILACGLFGLLPYAPELRAAPAGALASGAAALAKALLRPANRVSAAYGAAFAAIAASAAALLVAPAYALAAAGLPAAAPAPLLCRLAGIAAFPAAAAAAVLADAAGRGRLGGSTFRHLNASMAVAGAVIAVATGAAARAAAPLPVYWAAPAAAAATAALCATQFAAHRLD